MVKTKKFIAGGMLAVMLMSQLAGTVTPVVAKETGGSMDTASEVTFNKEGLWLTEIYQNDVDRSKKSDTRVKSGYEPIKTYSSGTDLMEFVEITSTYDHDIKFNDMYEFYYGDNKQTVTLMDGSSDITIKKGEAVVLWNYRQDVSTAIPTEEEFREAMNIPDSAVVLKVNSNKVNWSVTSTFSLKTIEDQRTVSTFTAETAVHTQDGMSVELKIPDIGSEMEVYRQLDMPTAGYIYSGQLNGLVYAKAADNKYAEGVYITEIRPNDSDRKSIYGSSSDLMECVEVVNTTGKDVDLNTEYQVKYAVKEGSRKVLQLFKYDESAENNKGSDESCIVPAGGTAVLWCYRKKYLTDVTTYPSLKDFRETYNIPDGVPVYLFDNQNGLNNTLRAFETYNKVSDELVSSYTYNGTTDLKDNKSVDLMVNPEGPEMLTYALNSATSMGIVNEAQYTYLKDDGSSMTIRLDDVIPDSIMQSDELRVKFYYEESPNLPRTGITTYYRFDGQGSWYSSTEVKRRVPHLYETNIPADELFDHDYVEFYVSADNRYRSALTDIYRVNINKLNAVDGIRTNIEEGEQVSKTVSITANDGTDNSKTEIYVDGVKRETAAMFEDGAFFTLHMDGRDSYFHNAVTTTNDEVIASIAKWMYKTLDGQAIKIDNSYFTYNTDNNSYDVTLRIWAGTYGVTVNEYLEPDANREDFSVTELALKLINGNTYYPTAIGPDDAATSEKTNLSTDYSAVHKIGDSAGMCPYMDVSFSVPVTEVNAVGTQVDTTKLSEGAHTLKVTNGTDTKEVNFIVDNTSPSIDMGIEDNAKLTGKIGLNPQISDVNSLEEKIITLDGKEISVPFETTAASLGEGAHTLTVYAKDKAGNESEKTAAFSIIDAAIEVTNAETTDITDGSALLKLKVNSFGDTNAEYYKAREIETTDISTETAQGILPYIKYTVNVSDVKNDDFILVNWDGEASNSDETHASTMYVENTADNSWDRIASADEKGSITEASFIAENHVKDGKATIIIQCTADSKLPDIDSAQISKKTSDAVWDGNGVPKDYDFCFAWETDTQYYAEEWQSHYTNMNQWIVDNSEKLNIKYVMHTGDIVDDYDMTYEWENADKAMSIFDKAGLAYGVLGGNHDVAAGAFDYENYYKYFGENRFTSQPTYGGSYKNNRGHYDLISENGQDMIVVYMSWDIYQEEIDWMNEILQKYSDRKAILCFHTYTNVKNTSDTLLDYFGKLIQENVVAKNKNVMAVLNGHYHGSSYETAMFDDNNDGKYDRTVYQICTDYQSGFEGGSEYIKFLYFDIDNNKIYMNSYSPFLDDYNYYDKETAVLSDNIASDIEIDKMILDVGFSNERQSILAKQFEAYVCTNEKLGEGKADKDGNITMQLNNLESGKEYAWYAVVSNSNTGYAKTGVMKFITAKMSNDVVEENPSGSNAETGDLVSTGDTAAVWLWVLMIISASGILGGSIVYKIKRKKAENE
ncbi:MAG: metallophosphoesterase [Eubacteriales bacterium]|nr:metallophosphoesterase [Eubacteriales bacterium]